MDARRPAARRLPGRPAIARSGEDLKVLLLVEEEDDDGIAQARSAG
jgi:hypothetical protein